MKKNIADEKQEELQTTIKEIYELENQIRKEKKKKQIKLVLFILLIIFLFKVFVGEINITSPNLFSQHKNRLYSVEINSKSISLGVEEYQSIINIPYVFKYNLFSSHKYNGEVDDNQLKFASGEKLEININSFECFSEDSKYKISCVGITNENNIVKTSDTKYELLIRKTSKGEKVFYNGEFINEIEKYLTEKGSYSIFINAKYKNVKSVIYFIIKIE